MAHSLLDASALLALIEGEPGSDTVHGVLRDGAAMSVVNLAEVSARLHWRGWPGDEVAETARALGIEFLPFDFETALLSGSLRPVTARLGLGLGDRACLAAAATAGLPALTADRAWLDLEIPGVEIRCIR